MSKQVSFDFADGPHLTTNHGSAPKRDTGTHTAADYNVSRPIHYLGSKLRLVNLIREVVDSVEPSGGPICDLFAGSGTVAGALAKTRDVVAVDIQEYSRVLCSALLRPAMPDSATVDQFWHSVRSSTHAARLARAVEPLADYEAQCLDLAAAGELEPLCDFLEHGSLIIAEQSAGRPAPRAALRAALDEVIARLRADGLLAGPAALVTRYFGGIYFSFAQAAQLDLLLEATSVGPPALRNSFLAAILSTASEVVNTVGKQFAQPIRPRTADGRPKLNLVKLVARDRFVDILEVYERWLQRYLRLPRTHRMHRIIRQDYVEALASLHGEVSVVYADPPYTRDHYSRFYHVLETLCLRDNPSLSTVRIAGRDQISRGIYRAERYQSPFCIKSQAPQAFATLFASVRQLNVPLVLSYSPYEKSSGARPRLLTIAEIEALARRYFNRVETFSAGRIAHNKLNHTEKNVGVAYGAEVLVTCRS